MFKTHEGFYKSRDKQNARWHVNWQPGQQPAC